MSTLTSAFPVPMRSPRRAPAAVATLPMAGSPACRGNQVPIGEGA